jgi:hypothetical protein
MKKNLLINTTDIGDTRTYRVQRGTLGNKKGFNFVVGNNFVSALYKTQKESITKMFHYLSTGDYDFYGSAE